MCISCYKFSVGSDPGYCTLNFPSFREVDPGKAVNCIPEWMGFLLYRLSAVAGTLFWEIGQVWMWAFNSGCVWRPVGEFSFTLLRLQTLNPKPSTLNLSPPGPNGLCLSISLLSSLLRSLSLCLPSSLSLCPLSPSLFFTLV